MSQAQWERFLHSRWECRALKCGNFKALRYSMNPFEHFKIEPPEHKSWANAILFEGATIDNPSLALHQYWRTAAGGGNQLRPSNHPKTKKRRSDSVSDEDDSEREYQREKRKLERREQRQRQEEDGLWRADLTVSRLSYSSAVPSISALAAAALLIPTSTRIHAFPCRSYPARNYPRRYDTSSHTIKPCLRSRGYSGCCARVLRLADRRVGPR